MATISDVAKRAGVAPVTVSRVINNAANVNPATRERVLQAIEALGYVPSGVAQSLRSKRTRSLALLLPDITNTFWTTVARGVEDVAQSHGYSILLCNTDESIAKQQRYLDVIISQRVDGVIIAPCNSEAVHLAKLQRRHIPTVVVDRQIDGWAVDTVSGDSISAARALVRHLIGVGHRRIAAITGPANASTAADRVAGYRMALLEAGIPFDPRLVKYGEFRAASGERLALALLSDSPKPTAIFAASNAIAVGVVKAVVQQNLRIPHDVALVCFDDQPNAAAAYFFPFFTTIMQPAYEMGVNAAQLLFSRLEAGANLQPRQVILPARLLVRHSCGSRLKESNGCGLSLPLPGGSSTAGQLVKPLGPEEKRRAAAGLTGVVLAEPARRNGESDYDKPDINRLLRALRHQQADRVPHLELWITSQAVYEYVLEHKLDYPVTETVGCTPSIRPEDHVEFARRLGMDAVVCEFSWRPNNIFKTASNGSRQYVDGSLKRLPDLDNLEPPPSLADQLNLMEQYLRAAQGTGVGVFANFTSFFDSAMLAVGLIDSFYMFYDNRPFLEKLMDILLDHQERVMRAVCDRFADDLAFVMVNDDIAHNIGPLIHPDMFMEIFPHRMARLVAPAKEHGKLVGIHTDGKLDKILPILDNLGFDFIHPVEPEANDIFSIKADWGHRLALFGNIPTALLLYGHQVDIEARVREYCKKLASGGGFVLGSSASIMPGIPPENFVAMTRAVHKYGRYGALGKEG